jgi:hypothetical protein
VLEEIWRVSDRARAETLSGLSAADCTQLSKLMRRIQSNVDALIPGAADTSAAARKPARKRVGMHAQAAKA